MSEDDLTDDFDRHTGTRGIGGGMPAQIVRAKFHTDQLAGFDHHDPGRLIGNRKYLIIGRIAHLHGVFAQPVCHFLGDEHKLVFFAAFGFAQD